jgi:opacity protein-like surface antigen
MRTAIFTIILTAIASIAAVAQDDYRKGEFYIGYSHGRVETGGVGPATQANTGIDDKQAFHGFNASGVYNVTRYFGIKGDVSGAYNNTRFSFPVTTGASTQTVSFDSDRSLYNFLGGVQVKDNSTEKRVKPFAHALAGIAKSRNSVSALTCTSTALINCAQINSQNESGFAMAFGGGVDVRVSDRIDLRLVQVDYNPITFDERTTNNFRFGIGIVIK